MKPGVSAASLAQDGGADQPFGIPVVVLAGGRATRLNGDKALAPFAGATLLDAVLSRLRATDGPRALNANGDPARFARFALSVHADAVAGFPGPLAGVLAAMAWAGSVDYVATVPTDTPLLPLDLIARLARRQRDAPAEAVICAASRGRLHPVIALWPTRLHDALRETLVVDKNFRVRDFMARFPVIPVTFDAADYDPFMNVNSPDDLLAAERAFASIRSHPGAE